MKPGPGPGPGIFGQTRPRARPRLQKNPNPGPGKISTPVDPYTYIYPKFPWRMIIEFREEASGFGSREAFGFPLVTQLK